MSFVGRSVGLLLFHFLLSMLLGAQPLLMPTALEPRWVQGRKQGAEIAPHPFLAPDLVPPQRSAQPLITKPMNSNILQFSLFMFLPE